MENAGGNAGLKWVADEMGITVSSGQTWTVSAFVTDLNDVIRFHKARGLVTAVRTAGNQRRFLRADLRRVSFAQIAQQLGLSLGEIAAELATLPQGRAPTRADWQAISRRIRGALQDRIAVLERTRDRLDGCIGCGCLSLARCALYNPGDRAAKAGGRGRAIWSAIRLRRGPKA